MDHLAQSKENGEGVIDLGSCHSYLPDNLASTGQEGVAGLVMFKELGIPYSYTLENSLCGFINGHWEESDYENVGYIFCEALWKLLGPQEDLTLSECTEKQESIPVVLENNLNAPKYSVAEDGDIEGEDGDYCEEEEKNFM
jgi:hypothetical protein